MSEITIPGTTPGIPSTNQVEALEKLALQRFKREYQSMDPFEIAMRSAIDPVFRKEIETLLAEADVALAKAKAKVRMVEQVAAKVHTSQATP